MKAGNPCPEAVRKEADVGVVVLHRLVVAPAFHGDAVFGAGKFILQGAGKFSFDRSCG